MKKLDDLKWKPLWTSHIGCLKGCADYLGLDLSLPWIYGATGHAFLLNMHELDCPSGPTAWKPFRFLELCRNLGIHVDHVMRFKGDGKFEEVQEAGWELVRNTIDADLPCYGWALQIPEYYVIHGYDDVGYYFSGACCEDGEGPKAWQELGVADPGWFAVFAVRKCEPANQVRQVKDAFGFALEFSRSPEKYIYPPYKAGLDGYDNWINIMKKGELHPIGTPYNAAVWAECREYAVKFMAEAKKKVGTGYEKLFDDAIAHYKVVADHLEKLRELYPFCEMKPEFLEDSSRMKESVEHLKEAKRAEEYCLILMRKIHKEL